MKYIIMFFVRLYRLIISPLKPPCCRFVPTCSAYCLEAVSKFGALKGSILAINRIIRCNPWNKGGPDPVPDEFRLFKSKK